VVASVVDNAGGVAVLASDPTDAVVAALAVPGNVAATGDPIVLDDAGQPLLGNNPRAGEALSVLTRSIADADGLSGVVFNFRWQESADGNTFTTIPRGTGRVFTPSDAQVGQVLRVQVFFTDQGGSVETRVSDTTAAVRAGRVRAGRGPRPPIVVLSALSVPRVLAAGTTTAAGLRVSFTAPAGTTVVRVRVFKAGSTRVLAARHLKAKRGKMSFVLRDRAITKALSKKGKYLIELTPGSSRTKLGKSTTRTIVIR
jgi:hypothetical protein